LQVGDFMSRGTESPRFLCYLRNLGDMEAKMESPEILDDPIIPEKDQMDSAKRPVTQIMFTGRMNQVDKQLKEIEEFLDVLKDKEKAHVRNTAFDVPTEIDIGDKTYQLHRLPAGYRLLMTAKLKKIAKIVPERTELPADKITKLLQQSKEKNPEELAKELLSQSRDSSWLAKVSEKEPQIFDLMLETIQLALQAPGKPEFDDKGQLKNPKIDIETLRWHCDLENVFNSIVNMNMAVFFTVQSVQRALAI